VDILAYSRIRNAQNRIRSIQDIHKIRIAWFLPLPLVGQGARQIVTRRNAETYTVAIAIALMGRLGVNRYSLHTCTDSQAATFATVQSLAHVVRVAATFGVAWSGCCAYSARR
jgi:hypothetical protein